MQRVVVIGSGGAGKSTFAARLAHATGLPLVSLDATYWRSGWIAPTDAEWAATLRDLVAAPHWILDGNYGGSLATRIAACDTVVFMDLPWWTCLARVVMRRIRHHGSTRPGMADGCNERLTWRFAWWIATYPIVRRPAIRRQLAALAPGQRAIALRSGTEAEGFLRGLGPAVSAP